MNTNKIRVRSDSPESFFSRLACQGSVCWKFHISVLCLYYCIFQMYSRWSQHFSVLSVPHAGSCLTQEFWCSYQQDKQIFPSATWACRRNKKEGGRETVRSMFSRNSCLSWDLKLLTFFSVATGEWCSTAAARSESVSWPSEQSLSESRACALDILKLLFNREKQ